LQTKLKIALDQIKSGENGRTASCGFMMDAGYGQRTRSCARQQIAAIGVRYVAGSVPTPRSGPPGAAPVTTAGLDRARRPQQLLNT